MQLTDAELVAESLAGKRDAFRQIVERYQTLISTLTYYATGNISQSEEPLRIISLVVPTVWYPFQKPSIYAGF